MTEKESNKWYALGQITGIEMVEGMLREAAKKKFGVGKDSEAVELRNWADLLLTMANTERRDYDKKYHAEKKP